MISTRNLLSVFTLFCALLATNVATAQNLATPGKTLPKNVVATPKSIQIPKPITGFEQQPANIVSVPGTTTSLSVINTDEIGGATYYDLQSNASENARLHVWPDGNVSMAYTTNPQNVSVDAGYSKRGTAVNYRSSWTATPWTEGVGGTRVEAQRTGFSNYVVTDNGTEVTLAHRGVTASSYRIVAARKLPGASTWVEADVPTNTPNGGLWCKAAVDGNTIHMIMLTTPVSFSGAVYKGLDGHVLYYRSKDAGATWDIVDGVIPGLDSTVYRTVSAENYTITARDGQVAVAVSPLWTDFRYAKSFDGGDTWEPAVAIIDSPLDKYDGEPYTIEQINGPHPLAPRIQDAATGELVQDSSAVISTDNRLSIAFDANGTLHVAFGLMFYADSDFTDQLVSFYPGQFGICYWNDLLAPNDFGVIGLVGEPLDLNNDSIVNIPVANYYNYGFAGYASMPSVATGDNNDIYIAYSSIVENLLSTNQSNMTSSNLRHVYIVSSPDGGNSWTSPTDILFDQLQFIPGSDSIEAQFTEAVFPVMYKRIANGNLHLQYQADFVAGSAVSDRNDEPTAPDQYSRIVYYHSDYLVGTKQVAPSVDFSISPNPAMGNAFLSLNLKDQSLTRVQVIDINGRVAQDLTQGNLGQGAHTIQINTSALPNGAYFVRVQSGNSVGTKKLMVLNR